MHMVSGCEGQRDEEVLWESPLQLLPGPLWISGNPVPPLAKELRGLSHGTHTRQHTHRLITDTLHPVNSLYNLEMPNNY